VSALPIQSVPSIRFPVTRKEPHTPDEWPVREAEMEFAPFQLDKAAVAALGPVDIARLTHRELIAAVVAAELPHLQADPEERLRFLDRWTLERLVYLARHCCRNQGY
jgi:hypothetical protein